MKLSGVPHKHDHVSGRPRDYISRKKFYKGKHRGEYRPRPHWRCKTCTSNCNHAMPYVVRSVILRPYIPPGMDISDTFMTFTGDDFQTIPVKL